MKFIVVVVTYNRKNLLEECIYQLLNQTVEFEKIIIVNNASTDGTEEILCNYEDNKRFIITNEKENNGGAYGFYRGMKIAMELQWDWVLLIDDDAIIRQNFLEKIKTFIEINGEKYGAYSGTVITQGKISCNHRCVNKLNFLYSAKPIKESNYKKPTFFVDFASFCGLIVNREIVNKIGLPEYRLFIRCDDFEYCMRIREYSKIVNVNAAVLEHKTSLGSEKKDLSWKVYYSIRNGIYMTKQHFGSFACFELVLRYYLGLVKNMIIYSFLKQEVPLKYLMQLYLYGIRDGKKKKLGKNQMFST